MKIILPFSVSIPRKKSANKIWILNLNSYRNTHHFTLNTSKILWKEIVVEALSHRGNDDKPTLRQPLRFVYTVYPETQRKFDLVQKFTDDALIDLGIIPDDNYKIIAEVVYRYGGWCKSYPRIELEIESIS
jgi:Holliday junction resolvase RusA-like endonuclease